MKRSIIKKMTFREIRQSFGRFFAILAIVALGVGFFSGLKVTKTDMIETTENYFEEKQFYDYRLLSTLGFEEEDVAFLRGQEDVRAAEGAWNFDILYENEEGIENVAKVHSLTTEVNQVELVAGRMPENGKECVADATYIPESSIGEKIRLSQDNAEEDLESFAYTEYTITGLVKSSLYIQFERGNTSLGNGKVSCFLYLLPESFDADYYTEVYVKFDKDFPLYSEEYEDYMDGMESDWKALTEQAADHRYERIVTEAQEELADGEKELEAQKAEAQAEFADALAELTDAEEQLTDGEEQLKEARQQLAEARETLEEKEQELATADQTLREKEQELTAGEQELAAGREQLQASEEEITAGEQELEKGYAALEQQRTALEGMEAAGMDVSLQKEQLLQAEQQLNSQKAQLRAAREQMTAASAQLQAAQSEIEQGRAALETAKAEAAAGEQQLEAGRQELARNEETLKEKEAELASGRQEYQEGMQEYQDAVREYEEQIAEAEAEIADARQEIEELEEPDSYVLGRDANVGYACFDSDASIVEGVADVFPVFFFLVAALVCMTTMNRMVEEQRTQIGVMKALGYGEATIMSKYIVYSGMAAVTGCVLGFFGGTYIFSKVIWEAYGMMYYVDDIVYVFDWKLALISLLVSVLCSVGVTLLSCHRELNLVAAELMRPKSPKAGKRVFLEYIPVIWKRLGFLKKVSVRNIFRYKKRLFMMVVGISGCTALLLTGFGVRDSVVHIADKQFQEIQTYDMSVNTADPIEESLCREVEECAGGAMEDMLCVMESAMDVVTENGRKAVSLVVTDPEKDISPFLKLHTESGESISYPDKGEAVITQKVAEELGVRAGDTVRLENEDMESITVKISGISQNFIYNYIYIGADSYREQMSREPEYRTLYIKVAQGDVYQLSADLMGLDDISSVSVNQDMQERIGTMMRSMDLIVVVIILCAAGLAFIVLYNLTNINITERVREIATIKVLGFYKRETASYVFRENMILTLMGTAVGLVLGYYLHRFVMDQIRIDMVSFDVNVSLPSYLYSILLTLVFAWLVNRFMRIKLDRISMTESLKSVD